MFTVRPYKEEDAALRPAGIASTKDSFHALWIRTIKYFCVTTHRS